MIPKMFKITTTRFILRIPDESDFPFIFSATRHKGFNDGMLWDPPQSMEELVEPLQNSLKAWDKEEAYSFTITKKASPDLIGRISIRKTDTPDLWNVGFWTHPDFQNKGVISEALPAVLSFGFEELAAEKIEACYALWNKASERVLVKSGMKMERYIKEGFMKKGVWVEENLFSIDKEQWKKLTLK